ncbi:serine hydrolase [Lewinella cohaerens]|uniref:serine hydrolase n=1 Tax=Lewinella cohaerens TaxID=70995 RepID=UPI000366F0A0|nr:serine hydrolase [Lewinella cohaerens]
MKNILTITSLLFCSFLLRGQENEHLFFLETDTSWRKEMFIFPINFARDIDYQGVEDARFPRGWEEQDSPNFWSYAYAWNLENSGDVTEADLETSLQKYFVGLMRWEETSVQLSTTNNAVFTGVVKTMDAFFTKEPMDLNVLVEKTYCEEKNKSIILFRFSPKGFEADVWNKLKEVQLPLAIASCEETKVKKIHDLIQACSDYGQFNGSVLVAENGEIIYKNGFGQANMEWNIPNKPDTKHRLASITKQFTAMAIVQLVAENKLELNQPITTYLPDYPKATGDSVTIHHLLTHTSGIPNYTSFPSYREVMRAPHSAMELVSLFADLPLEFTPGEQFAYSNSGYVLLGVLIEKITGKPYEQVLQDKIFSPLEMNDTGYDQHRTILENRASGYNKIANTFESASYIDMSVAFAAGALYSTVEDLYRWDQALYTEKLLPKEYMDLLFDTHIAAWGQHYGYGWEIGKLRIGNTQEYTQTISHGGNINGFNTQITRIPASQSLILLFNNTGLAPLYDMTTAINGILHDKPYISPKRSMAYALLDKIQKDGIAPALLYYNEIKKSDDYHLNENEMNLSGYQLIQSGKVEDAAAVFKLNAEAFPNSFNVYDSYGEALMMLGDTAQAIENYKKSVQLNPNNENGIQILKGLGIDTESLITKVPVEHLRLLAGEYMATDQPNDWKIVIEELNGELFGNDGGYRYKLNPIGNDKFINPDDGATVVFDTKDKTAITFVIFGRVNFKKVK